MRKLLFSVLVISASLFTGCNFTGAEADNSKKRAPSSEPISIVSKNIFDVQSGSIRCFHDRQDDKEFDIACHAYVKHEDGSEDLADFVSKEISLSWLPPELNAFIQVSSLSCNVVHSNLGYRCHIITNNVIAKEDLAAQIKLVMSVVQKQSQVELRMENTLNLADNSDRIPPEIDMIIIGESFDAGTLEAVGLDTNQKKELIGSSPFADTRSFGFVTKEKKTPLIVQKAAVPQSLPTPVVAVDPVWFDNRDEEGNEKVSLQCSQLQIQASEPAIEEIPFQIRCELVASEDQKNSIQKSSIKVEGYSFPEGQGSNRISCQQMGASYICGGAILKENLENTQNQKPFARVELKLFQGQEYRLFTKTTSLNLQYNSRQ